MIKPITNRVKRTALFKYHPSALKQTKLGEGARVGGSEEGADREEIIEVAGTPGTENLDKLNAGKIDLGADFKPTKAQTDAANAEVAKAKKADADAAKPTKKKVIVKGDDLDYDTQLMQANYGTVAEPWEQAKLLSNIKRSGRNVRKAQNKLDKNTRKNEKLLNKYDKDGDGKLSDKEKSKMRKGFLGFGNDRRSYERNQSSTQENTAELKAFKADQANTDLATASGGVQGDKYQKADTEVTKGQRGAEQQLAEAKRKAKIAAKKKAAADAKGIEDAENARDEENEQTIAEAGGNTTGQSTNAIGGEAIQPINLGGGFGAGLDLYKTSSYAPVAAMTKKGYNMKAKSPATKKLQGAQNTLPSHLQAAIKAAPGKMKSVLKKGYFKNK